MVKDIFLRLKLDKKKNYDDTLDFLWKEVHKKLSPNYDKIWLRDGNKITSRT